MSLRSINFNLIPILRALLRERSVSRAAQSLGLTQSGASAALQRLREALRDPLLIRVGRAMELTPRARELIEPVEALCGQMDRLLLPPAFDPSQMRRTFSVATADFVALQVANRMIPDLRAHAPDVRLQLIEASRETLDQLTHGELDVAILPTVLLEGANPALLFRGVKRTTIRSRPLFRDHFVVVVGQNHRLAGMATLTNADLDAERHLIYYFHEDLGDDIRRLLAGRLPGAAVSAELQQLSLLPLLVLDTDTVAIVPKSLAQDMARWLPLTILDPPGERVALDISLIWDGMFDQDPAHAWFRERLQHALAGAP